MDTPEHAVADTQTLHETSCWSRSRQRKWPNICAWSAEHL